MSGEAPVLLLWLVLIQEGAAIRPVVTFTPNYKKIFTSERITLTCDVGSTIGEGLQFIWHKDNHRVPSGRSITIQDAKLIHSGKYRCQTILGEISDPVTLDVSNELFLTPTMTVTPHPVFRNDNVTLRCETRLHPHKQDTLVHFAFYRDDQAARRFNESNILKANTVRLEDSGKYSCEVATPGGKVRKKSAEQLIQIEELLSNPSITVTNDLCEGDPMTITCDMKLTPYTMDAGVQFAFYRDGRMVQGFNSSNKYEVGSAQLKDSGNYICEVKFLRNPVMRRSNESKITIKELFSPPVLTVSPELVNEGDNMTLTCHTNLNKNRLNTTTLQYAFYRNGRNVQGFNSTDKYEVHFIRVENFGTYTCEIQTSNSSVKKRSQDLLIPGSSVPSLMIIVSVSLGLILLIAMSICIFVCLYRRKPSSFNNLQPTPATDNEIATEAEVSYTVLDLSSRPYKPVSKEKGPNIVYAEVKSKASPETSDSSADIYQNIKSYT
ncbi:hypothetical protein GDO81_014809 [Engystomops pustulosus]|uniref:Ig-like domain-containing protein n=1 Tax=Engystomops pustulosus TaxID=76066 RepID=A0AAV7AJ63_ENGPU|nr:hypothetical protein GDO81_014809 [Engystomops pustulosus]